MEILVTILHVFCSIVLILTVLLQSGKGGGMGAAFGGGASNQIFGGRGAANFLTRVTSGAAIIFFLTSMTLAGLNSRSQTVGERIKQSAQEEQAAPNEASPADTTGAMGEGSVESDGAAETEIDAATAPADGDESPFPAETDAEERSPSDGEAGDETPVPEPSDGE